MFVRAYLRASTAEQDATRARAALDGFAQERGLHIAARYVENESGAKLARPELFRLLADCRPGDILLVEQVDRLSRLSAADWQRLRAEIDAKQVRIVALDLPTSWSLAAPPDEFTGRMFAAVNAMMLDVLAAVARKDYDDRRRRQAEGNAKAKAAGLFKGRQENKGRNDGIAAMLRAGASYQQVMNAIGCSRGTVAKIQARINLTNRRWRTAMPDNELIPIYTPGGGFYCKAGNPEAAEKLQREFIADFHPKLLPLYEGICLDKNSDDYGHPIFRPDAFDQGAP